jgi:hypothetical protein
MIAVRKGYKLIPPDGEPLDNFKELVNCQI